MSMQERVTQKLSRGWKGQRFFSAFWSSTFPGRIAFHVGDGQPFFTPAEVRKVVKALERLLSETPKRRKSR